MYDPNEPLDFTNLLERGKYCIGQILTCVPYAYNSCARDSGKMAGAAKNAVVHFSKALQGHSLTIMARSKRKPRKFSAGSEARRRARELAGPPPAARVIPDKRLKPPKHKKKLTENNG
jgi:hypothetical protein